MDVGKQAPPGDIETGDAEDSSGNGNTVAEENAVPVAAPGAAPADA